MPIAAPKEAILLVLLTWWLQDVCPDDGLEVLEYFAGVGRIAQLAQWVGYKSCAYDRDFAKPRPGKRGAMDLNSDAGLVLLNSRVAIDRVSLSALPLSSAQAGHQLGLAGQVWATGGLFRCLLQQLQRSKSSNRFTHTADPARR